MECETCMQPMQDTTGMGKVEKSWTCTNRRCLRLWLQETCPECSEKPMQAIPPRGIGRPKLVCANKHEWRPPPPKLKARE